MRLHPTAVEWYPLEITTDPAVSAWEASFDNGATWVASTTVGTDGYSRWLVAGPDATSPGTAIVLPLGRTSPRIRATDSPEVIVRTSVDGVPTIDVG